MPTWMCASSGVQKLQRMASPLRSVKDRIIPYYLGAVIILRDGLQGMYGPAACRKSAETPDCSAGATFILVPLNLGVHIMRILYDYHHFMF